MTQRQNRKLVLFRHAKSAWPDVPDHERPLAGRGLRAAPVMGRWLRDAGLSPDLVLCSTARRARETWQAAQTGLAATPPVSFEDRVYGEDSRGLLALMLAAAPGGAGPGAAAPGDLERMRAKFPTAAIAVLEATGTWHDLAPGQARLTTFVTPRDLPVSSDRRG